MQKVKRVTIKTSYFAKYRGDSGVSISRYTPKWYKGEEYKLVAPSKELLLAYKNNKCSNEEYAKIYLEELNKLDPNKVYNDLKGKVLLCYEKPSDFCHRHLLAKWMEDNLGIHVKEIEWK